MVRAQSTTAQSKTATDTGTKSNVVFKVQLLASAKSIPLQPERFNGLDVLSREPYKNLYRYMYGEASTLEDAEKLKKIADSKGYPTSFIVAYKNGKRVTIAQALK